MSMQFDLSSNIEDDITKTLRDDPKYLTLGIDQEESFFYKVVNFYDYIYKFSIDVTDNVAKITFVMDKHNTEPKNVKLEIYESQHLFVPKKFYNKLEIDDFFNTFFNK